MKLHTERENIERVGVDTEREFTIKTTAKAFDILSSGLYTDNVLAIVRELSCNAFDAHVAADKAEVPFEIHLPNRLEPFFSVKDFGTGLSDDQIMTLYTTYFDSTKTDSNDFIGALGLGSKSPFSYTNAFEVVARYEGTRRVYSVFINEDGVPTIARIGDPIKTDELNGIEVKMTVSDNDFYKFKDKTADALRWFPVKPTVVGDPYFNFSEPPATEVQGNGWYIYKRDYGAGTIAAVQGNVEYRVDLNQIENIDDSIRTFLKTVNVIGFFEIGELEVAASREEIRYDKRTKEALAKKINSIHKAALKTIEDKADELTDGLWNAIIELNKLAGQMFRDRRELCQFVKSSDHKVLHAYSKCQGRVGLAKHTGHDVFVYKWSQAGSSLKREKLTAGINPDEGTVFFINDMRTGGVSRLTKWMRDNRKQRAVVIVEHKAPFRFEEVENINGKPDMVKRAMTEAEVAAELNNLIEGFGHPKVMTISQDTAAIKRDAKSRLKAIFKYKDWRRNEYRPSTVVWDRVEELDMSTGGLYFLLERGHTIRWNGKAISWNAINVKDELSMMVNVVNAHFNLKDDDAYDVNEVIGVGAVDIKKFDKDSSWLNVFDLFNDAIPTYASAAIASHRWEVTPNVHGLKTVFRDKEFLRHVSKTDVNSPFRKTVETLQREWDNIQAIHLPHTVEVHRFDNQYGNRIIKTVDVEGYINDDALSMYPMMKFVDRIDSYDTDLATLFDYINTLDGSK